MLFSRVFSRFTQAALTLALLIMPAASCIWPPTASALVKMDPESITLALKYGMQNASMGLMTVLGPNWVEGPNGNLLNIYTPFMVLATKAAKGGYPSSPKQEDIDAAKKRYARILRNFKDSRTPIQVKFAVSMVGESPEFAYGWRGRIEGIGRGQVFKLQPAKTITTKLATSFGHSYEAVNAYYFNFSELAPLDEFQFIVEPPSAGTGQEPLVFKINNKEIY